MFLDLKIENVVASTSVWSDANVAAYKMKNNSMVVRLEEYLLDGGNLLDAEKIRKSIFPDRDIDIFISHSHRDEDQAVRTALSLEESGLTSFVDSCVWGHADDLLKKIDDKFCIPEGWTSYSYSRRNRTTTNVHLILNAALQRMIHRSELFIFLGTENSIKIDRYMSDVQCLSSPWIFSELTFAQNVERTKRKQIVRVTEDHRDFVKAAVDDNEVGFRYVIPQSTFTIDHKRFVTWLGSNTISDGTDFDRRISGLQHLDKLYMDLGVDPKFLQAPRVK